MSTGPREFDPLLPLGRHVLPLAQLRTLCVTAFPTSVRRPVLMAALEDLVSALAGVGLKMEAWVDGSFLTRKIEPADVDVVIRAWGEDFEALSTDELRKFAEVLHQGNRRGCHVSWFTEYPSDHSDYWSGEYDYCYWMGQWGYPRLRGNRKGIAVVVIEGEKP